MYSESESKVGAEADEEEKIYQFIYGMHTASDRDVEDSFNVQPPSSAEHSPVYVKNHAERRFHPVVSTTKGPCMDVDIQEIPVEKIKVKSTEKKPWREPGADISDYFNYGFDEESWKSYCKKQSNLCAANAKRGVQKGQRKCGGKELCCGNALSGWSCRLTSRHHLVDRESSHDVTGVRHGSSRIAVVTKISSIEDRSASSKFGFLTYVSPPSFFYQHRGPPRSSGATLDSGQAEECNISAAQNPLSSESSVARTVASSAAVTNTDKCRRRPREHDHNKSSKRGREGQMWSRSSQSSREKQMWHRDTRKREHRRRSKRDSGGKDEEHRREGWQKPRSSTSGSKSNSRRGDGEDRKSQNRHNHKIPRDMKRPKAR